MIRYKNTLEKVLQMHLALKENGVCFFYCEPPAWYKIRKLSDFEKFRILHWVFDFNNISGDIEKLERIFGTNVDPNYISQLYDGAKIIQKGGLKTVADFSSKYVNVVGGMRVTCDVPARYHNKIHLFGGCTLRGTGVEDRHTIASFLQKKVNASFPGCYRVVNHGLGCGSTLEDDLMAMENTIFQAGDIVILTNQFHFCLIPFCKKHNISCLETSPAFEHPHSHGEWFTDLPLHTNKNGNSVIAEVLYEKLNSDNILSANADKKNSHKALTLVEPRYQGMLPEENNDLYNYLENLKHLRIENYTNKKIGAIVMNCNPFTFGHRFLIEHAAASVDHLYIFIVEENKSFFPFEDRYNLVKSGTADLPNVDVLPSGSFIISALTFPGYFYKENNQDAIVDTSADVDLFGKYIAKVLNVTIRFMGEEPLDPVTRQYNETMKERLPLYGVDCVEIPRKEFNSEVISASRVRRYLKDGKLEDLTKLVPQATYLLLKEKYIIKENSE